MGTSSKYYSNKEHKDFNQTDAIKFIADTIRFELSNMDIMNVHLVQGKLAFRNSECYDSHELYLVCKKHSNNQKIGVVVKIDIEDNNIYWKYIDETMGPRFVNCPKYMIQELSPTTNELSLKWRKACLANSR